MCEREIESMQETVLERQARMRERARQLKEKKEDSRMEYVMQKYEQQWRYYCYYYYCLYYYCFYYYLICR